MHLHQVNKGILPLLFILGLFKITGLEAVENQKGKEDISDYEDDNLSIEPEVPNSSKSTENPYFEPKANTVYATREGENVTIKCQPKRFDEAKHEIIWYRNDLPITTGNTTLVVGDFVLDTKYSLIILNYTKSTPYNFSCGLEPGHARQNMSIVFNPPDNISEPNGAANINNLASYFQVAAMTLVLVMTANAWN